jgi:hypothetical protein
MEDMVGWWESWCQLLWEESLCPVSKCVLELKQILQEHWVESTDWGHTEHHYVKGWCGKTDMTHGNLWQLVKQ